jgi:O-antigen ligase
VIQSTTDVPSETQPVEAAAILRKPAAPSLWIWVPFVWLFFVSTRSLSSWLTIAGHDATVADPDLSGNPVDSGLFVGLIILGLVVLCLRMQRARRILVRNKWLIVLFVYMALSILWSNFPAITFRRVIRSGGTLVMVLVVLTEQNPREAIRALLRSLYLLIVPLSVIAIKYVRNIGVAYDWSGVEEMWVGLTMHKNNLGQVAMCSGLVATWQVLQHWSRRKLTLDLLLLVPTLWILRGSKNSHSSTAILGLIVGLAVLFGLQCVRRRKSQAKRAILAVTMAVILIAPLVYFAFEAFDTTPMEMMLAATNRDMTFTGRTGLWKDLLNYASKSPVVGVGLGAFWVGPIGYAMYPLDNWSQVTPDWRPGEGHNGFLDVYVDLGLVGVVLILFVFASAFAGALDDLQSDFEIGRLRLALLLSLVMNNLTESSLLKGTHSLWFIFLLAAVSVPSLMKRARPLQLQAV